MRARAKPSFNPLKLAAAAAGLLATTACTDEAMALVQGDGVEATYGTIEADPNDGSGSMILGLIAVHPDDIPEPTDDRGIDLPTVIVEPDNAAAPKTCTKTPEPDHMIMGEIMWVEPMKPTGLDLVRDTLLGR